MDNPLLVGMLDRPANLREESQSLPDVELPLVAIVRKRLTLDELHHKIRTAVPGHPPIVDPGNVGMIHQGERLALGFKTRHDLLRIHSRLDDLQGHNPSHRHPLLGPKHHAESPLPGFFHQEVAPHQVAGLLRNHVHLAR